jgi:hypothetical protein
VSFSNTEFDDWVLNFSDGYTYERSAVEEWLSKKRTSPLTNEVLISTDLTPNLTLKAVMNRLLLSSEPPC